RPAAEHGWQLRAGSTEGAGIRCRAARCGHGGDPDLGRAADLGAGAAFPHSRRHATRETKTESGPDGGGDFVAELFGQPGEMILNHEWTRMNTNGEKDFDANCAN